VDWELLHDPNTSLVLISAFPLRFSFSSSPILKVNAKAIVMTASKDSKGDKGSKHSKHSKEYKVSEDNEGRKGRTIPHKKGQVDASLDGQC
jgi:hypothetical protein